MGYVYYAEYLHFFERARSAYIRQCGMSYADIEKQGILLPVREANCRYRKPARYDDLILIGIGVSEWGRASVRFVYEVLTADKELLATGSTQHAITNREGKPIPLPSWFKEMCSNLKYDPSTPLY